MADWSAIVAVDVEWGIGYRNALPWRLPDDLKRFKALTMGGVVVMGRLTHESIGRALPGRRNVILTRQMSYEAAEGCEVCHDVASLETLLCGEERPVWIIGGAGVYEALMEQISIVELTLVHGPAPLTDVRLQPLSASGWEVVTASHHPIDAAHERAFDWVTLRRIPEHPWCSERAEVPLAWRAASTL